MTKHHADKKVRRLRVLTAAGLVLVFSFLTLLGTATALGTEFNGGGSPLQVSLVFLYVDREHVGDPGWRNVGTVLTVMMCGALLWLLFDVLRQRARRRSSDDTSSDAEIGR